VQAGCSHLEMDLNEKVLTINPSRLLDIDDFIENLWKIHVQVKSEGYVQVGLDSQLAQMIDN